MGLFDWLKGGKKDDPPARPHQQPPPLPPQRQVGSSPPPLPSRQPQQEPPRRPAKLDLELGQFAPLSDADIKQRASAGFAAGAFWQFGRTSVIPPVTDPRTLLIDRAMVGHGFITPEELTEIHRVGEQMDRARPTMETAGRMADAAVQQRRQDKERIKERKKAEAAEKKRRHAEAVALRRRTDIVFLGRGVSKDLSDRRADVEKLQAAGLPVLATPADVAKAMGIDVPRLRWLAFHSDATTVTHYVRFTVPKRGGGERQLSAPHRGLAAAQAWILLNILEKVATPDPAHGFVPGRSTVTNASPHVGRRMVVNTDLTNFFPTIMFPRVKGIFRQLGYSPAAATVLALLCTESPRRTVKYAGTPFHVATGPRGLPQGACTSPALSNLAARRLDSRLSGIARKLGWTYTRYADDLTLSADGEAADKVGYILARVRHIAQDEGFAVNEKKTRVQRPSMRQTVTGVVVNARPGVPRDLARRMRAILHRAKSEGLAAQNRQNHPHFEAWVRGMVSYISMVNPAQGKPLRETLETLGE